VRADLPALLDARGARGEREVGGDTGVVLVDRHPDATHGLEHVDRERADLQISRLLRRAP
jgi:hypothetical protein